MDTLVVMVVLLLVFVPCGLGNIRDEERREEEKGRRK